MAEKQIPVLTANLRESRGKQAAKHMRNDGRVPAVVYHKGDDGVESLALDLDVIEVQQLVAHRPTLIEVKWGEKDGEKLECILREVQRHPVSREVLHMDLYGVTRGQVMDSVVPIRLEGIPVGVKDEGGILQQTMYEIPIKVLPRNLPNEIVIDVSGMEMNDSMHVEDIKVEDIELNEIPERTVCTVVPPRLPEEDETAEEETETTLIGEEGAEGAEGEDGAEGEGENEE